MNKFEIEQKKKQVSNSKKRKNLQKLYRMLTYESSAVITLAAIPLIGYALLLPILTIAILVSVPFMVSSLYKMKKMGWLISFILLITIPFLFSLFFSKNLLIYTIFSSVGMFNFFAYCWIFKFVVKEWLEDLDEDDFESEREFDFNDSGC